MRLRYTDRARDDLELAFSWYERQRRGLGFDFLDCAEVALQNIIENPEMYQIRYSNSRNLLSAEDYISRRNKSSVTIRRTVL